MSAAETILAQLGGASRLKAMTGARDFVGGDADLTFRFRARALDGINAVRVTLDASDTYTVECFAVKNRKPEKVAASTGVYAEGLRETIEHHTGLCLSL